jgi:hypothetical protein
MGGYYPACAHCRRTEAAPAAVHISSSKISRVRITRIALALGPKALRYVAAQVRLALGLGLGGVTYSEMNDTLHARDASQAGTMHATPVPGPAS